MCQCLYYRIRVYIVWLTWLLHTGYEEKLADFDWFRKQTTKPLSEDLWSEYDYWISYPEKAKLSSIMKSFYNHIESDKSQSCSNWQLLIHIRLHKLLLNHVALTRYNLSCQPISEIILSKTSSKYWAVCFLPFLTKGCYTWTGKLPEMGRLSHFRSVFRYIRTYLCTYLYHMTDKERVMNTVFSNMVGR